jgi:flagellar FliJ protein
MRKFQFRLQSVLDLRRRHEESLRAELARMHQRRQEEVRRLETLLQEREAAMHGAVTERVGRMAAEDLHVRERRLEGLERSVRSQQEILDLILREIDRKVAEVVAATTDTRALEDLRARHMEDHRREAQRVEQHFLDELATTRAARGRAAA